MRLRAQREVLPATGRETRQIEKAFDAQESFISNSAISATGSNTPLRAKRFARAS
ncbi:MAG: hypothetical protein WKF84_04480 [Pyrinomonadaceae bacterium]